MNIYGLDYLGRKDALYDLDEGDCVHGEIVKLKVEPVLDRKSVV